MRMFGWMWLAIAACTGVGNTPAMAQPEHVRVVERTRVTYTSDRRWDRDRRANRGRHWNRDRHRYRDGWAWRTSCRTQWRYGHRERVCRKGRYRRY